MKKERVLFVHGGQGCGKTTVTNLLREQLTHTTLVRLAGVPSMNENADSRAFGYHLAMLESVFLSAQTGMNFVFDRSYLCEKVYSNLGFKSHDFQIESQVLKQQLERLTPYYDVWFVLLTTTEDHLKERLNRADKPQFENVKFDVTNSLNQQESYRKEFSKLPSSVKTLIIRTDHLEPKEVANLINILTRGDVLE